MAGRDILKTIQVSDARCAEDFNLRTNIIAYASTHDASGGAISAKHKDQLAANDVKWSHGGFSTTIATAAANGQIVVYDINRAGVEIARLHEHVRQVHRLGFNPHRAAYMLSGSQDGTVRMWDLRDLAGDRSIMTCQSRQKYIGNSDGIRDLRWSPTDGTEFAVGTDNGIVQCWDIRKPVAPSLKISAHDKSCHSIDWHPDGKYLVSGGTDKNIRVWDTSSSNRRMKPSWEIRAPQAVLNVRWRPACWLSDRDSPAAWRCTQIATSYDQQDPRMHIWDFRSPYVPLRVLDKYDTPATAMLWHSESLLWSVGSIGMFTQTDVKFTTKTMDQISPNTLDIAPNGKILFFSQKRERRRTSIEDVLDNLSKQDQRRSSTGERLSGSHSTLLGSSEGLSTKNRQRKGPSSLRSIKPSADTPPSAGSGGAILGLDSSLETGVHLSSQVAGIGYVEGLFDADAFTYIARHQRAPSPVPASDKTCDLHHGLSEAFRANSSLSANTGQYRLSQSWQILALAVDHELYSRAAHSYHQRKTLSSPTTLVKRRSLYAPYKPPNGARDEQERKTALSESEQPPMQLTTTLSGLEDASNMTTPLARPVPDDHSEHGMQTNFESLQLTDSTWSKQPPKPLRPISELANMASPGALRTDTNHSPDVTSESSQSDAESQGRSYPHHIPQGTGLVDMDRQMAERRAAIGNYRAIPRPLLRLDDPTTMAGSALNVPMFGHESEESFHLLSASTDSSHRGRSVIGSFESNPESQKSTSTPERELPPTDQLYDNTDQEDALVFDDEAQMRAPGSPQSSPPMSLSLQRGQRAVEFAESTALAILQRPAHSQQPIVHLEDMEEWPSAPMTGTDEPATKSDSYLISDFLPPEQEPDYFPPWTATAMLAPLTNYHTYKLHDAQLPAYLLLHLAPYLSQRFSYERATLILLQYHSQLVSLELYAQAAELRNLAHPDYVEVAEHGLYQIVPGGPWCTVCQKPSKGSKPRYCERCKQPWAQCPICNGEGVSSIRGSPGVLDQAAPATSNYPKGGDKLWGWCQDCGHGGHSGCLRIWWGLEESEGVCPSAGCLCDCMPGTRREEIVRRLEEERKPNKVVSKDERKVGPSPAVQKARGLLGGPGMNAVSTQGMGAGRGALSLGATGRSASGGKKVRIVAPEEEGRVGGNDGKGDDKTSVSVP